MKTKLLILATLLLFFASCEKKKEVYVDNLPQLEITVLDITHTAVDGVSVTIFDNETDFKSNSNGIKTSSTDSQGKVLFTDLEEKVYYFFAEKGDMNNLKNVSVIEKQLAINVKAQVKTVIK